MGTVVVRTEERARKTTERRTRYWKKRNECTIQKKAAEKRKFKEMVAEVEKKFEENRLRKRAFEQVLAVRRERLEEARREEEVRGQVGRVSLNDLHPGVESFSVFTTQVWLLILTPSVPMLSLSRSSRGLRVF